MKKTESFYRRLAKDIGEFVKTKIREGQRIVHYREVFQEFGIDRFTCARALGWLVHLNKVDGQPLWSSLVCRQTDDMCGEGFWWAANESGYTYKDKIEFMNEQRVICRMSVEEAPQSEVPPSK
jgi:DNA-directed RNA polymerase subunit N (RpoN/RPB10)